MKTNLSKRLGAIIARATFSTIKHGVKHDLLDHLFLEIITHEESEAFQFISSTLESWQLYKLRQRVEQSHPTLPQTDPAMPPEIYYAALLDSVSKRYPQEAEIGTLHILHHIASDDSTSTSKALSELGVSAQQIERVLVGTEAEPPPHPLDKFGVDMTLLARKGLIDPVVGRQREIERVIQILSRRKKSNPILIGEAGVGKSAIVEGLALRIAQGDVPHSIEGRRLFSLDISAIVAGTKFRGEFEERVKELLDALRKQDDAIVFIDEIHTIVGAGSSQGSLDVANLLKPALARGDFRAIGATTFDEYQRDIESDRALSRRFQQIVVEPTTHEETLEILRHIAPKYEAHHRVRYSEDALKACISLSSRYITDQHLPDKAIDLLDESGTRAPNGEVTVSDIEKTISMISGVPVTSLSQDQKERVRGLSKHLHATIIGQSSAVDKIANTIIRHKAGISDQSRPIGSFLFVGATGVGKTLLAKECAKWMFEGRDSLIRLDMSEYNSAHTISRLIGSPPGYVGYGEGGELTQRVQRQPYSVVLFDEIEKAHPEIFNLLLQLLDEGHLTDSAGRRVNFRNTIIIMTSNAGARKVTHPKPAIGYGSRNVAPRDRSGEYMRAIGDIFEPEFLNRIDEVVIFNDLSISDIERIVDLELHATLNRVRELGYNIRITPSARRELALMGYDNSYGARALKRKIISLIEEPLSSMIIEKKIKIGDEIVITKSRKKPSIELKVA